MRWEQDSVNSAYHTVILIGQKGKGIGKSGVLKAGCNAIGIRCVNFPISKVLFFAKCLFKGQDIRNSLPGKGLDGDDLRLHTAAPPVPFFFIFLF